MYLCILYGNAHRCVPAPRDRSLEIRKYIARSISHDAGRTARTLQLPGPDHPAQIPAARAAIFMGIFAAFLVPFSEAESDHCVTSISADHEEEHLQGPIDQTPDDR